MSDLETLMDRWAIEATISRLGRCLDERDFEGLRDLFTIDATVHAPRRAVTGYDALGGQARGGAATTALRSPARGPRGRLPPHTQDLW
ncbi:MAG: hypothetical protein JWP39_1427 [Jatrophihabitans sp.]|nr:hypothetical protein [Jatrophihabitans sp.]